MRVAVGCSYTSAVGVEPPQAYPCLMGYTNWAKPGTDIEYSLWCAHRAVDQGAEHILFQLTSWDRITLGTGTHNWRENRSWSKHVTEPTHLTVADYTQGVERPLFETHVMSNWRTENLAQRLHELRSYALSHNCGVRFYDWLPRHTIRQHPLVESLLPPQSVLDWLGNDYFVDSHYHINSQGHQLLAEQYFD